MRLGFTIKVTGALFIFLTWLGSCWGAPVEDDRFLKSAVKFSVFNPALVQVRSVGGGIDIEKLPRNYHKFKLDFNCGLVKPDFFFTLRVYADAGSTSYSDFSFGDYRVGSACNEFKSSFWDINNAIYFSGEDLFHPDVSGVYRHFMGEAVVPAGVVYYGRVFESSGHIFVFSDEKWLGHFSRKFGMKKTVSRMETFADSVARGRQDQLLNYREICIKDRYRAIAIFNQKVYFFTDESRNGQYPKALRTTCAGNK